LSMWGIYPWDDPRKSYIPISEVRAVTESPSRLPVTFANRLYAAGESKMGGQIFTVIFSDGLKQQYVTGNTVDFIQYPVGHTPNDVIDVLVGVATEGKPLEGSEHYWCIYKVNVPNIDLHL
jgi:hypothetical protein